MAVLHDFDWKPSERAKIAYKQMSNKSKFVRRFRRPYVYQSRPYRTDFITKQTPTPQKDYKQIGTILWHPSWDKLSDEQIEELNVPAPSSQARTRWDCPTSHKGRFRSGYYAVLMGECSNPVCSRKVGIEGHHITPSARGGADRYWNLIALCRKCHEIKGLHSRSDDWTMTLNMWKCQAEMRRFGFFLDDREDDFRRKLRIAQRIVFGAK